MFTLSLADAEDLQALENQIGVEIRRLWNYLGVPYHSNLTPRELFVDLKEQNNSVFTQGEIGLVDRVLVTLEKRLNGDLASSSLNLDTIDNARAVLRVLQAIPREKSSSG